MRAEHSRRRVWLVRTVIALLLLTIGVELLLVLRRCEAPGADIPVPDYVTQDFLPRNPFSRPGTPLQTVDGVVVHYVGNPGTSAAANRSYFANLALTHETYASAHFVVGLEGEIIQCVPLSEIAYCTSQANDHTLSIEVCHPDETGAFSPGTLDSLTTLTAWLCDAFALETSAVIRHYDVTGKLCPLYYVEHSTAWDALLAAVDAKRE